MGGWHHNAKTLLAVRGAIGRGCGEGALLAKKLYGVVMIIQN